MLSISPAGKETSFITTSMQSFAAEDSIDGHILYASSACPTENKKIKVKI